MTKLNCIRSALLAATILLMSSCNSTRESNMVTPGAASASQDAGETAAAGS